MPGLRKKEVCLMLPWLLMMEMECASWWAYKCEIQYPKSTAKDNFGLYHEDGFAVLKNKSGRQSEQVKKNIQQIFKEHGLDIIIQCNMKVANYLDATFNLNDETNKPYTKPNNESKYIRKNSKHPLRVIREIPLSIESRLSTLYFKEKTRSSTPY